MGRPHRNELRRDIDDVTFDIDGPELLPCPFCGGPAYYLAISYTDYAPTFDGKKSDNKYTSYPTFAVECQKCGAPGVPPVICHLGASKEEGRMAIAERWNRRANDGA